MAVKINGKVIAGRGKNGVTYIPSIENNVLSWTNDGGLENPTSVELVSVDSTLSVEGKAADAKAVGDAIATASSNLTTHTSNTSNPHGVTAAQVGADPTGTASTAVSTHNTNTSAHSDIRDLITGITTRLNTLADSDDTTLDQMSEVVAYIKSNKSLIDSITTSKVNVSDIIDNLTTNISNKPLSAAQGVVLKALIDALQTSLNEKGVGDMLKSTYDTDGNGVVDNAEKLGGQAPSYYATAANLTSHTGNTSNPHGVTLSQLGVNATADELNYVDGVTSNIQTQINTLNTTVSGKSDSGHTHSAYVNQNAFSNVTVGSTTIAADSETDTLTLVAGDNVTITPDATNDKITIAATDTVYTHPTYTAKDSGLYKVTVDGTGHVSDTTAVTKEDITSLGIPAQDTTYTLPEAGSSLGGVKTGGDVTISSGTITVNNATKATQDGNGNVITSTYATVSYVDSIVGGIETLLAAI